MVIARNQCFVSQNYNCGRSFHNAVHQSENVANNHMCERVSVSLTLAFQSAAFCLIIFGMPLSNIIIFRQDGVTHIITHCYVRLQKYSVGSFFTKVQSENETEKYTESICDNCLQNLSDSNQVQTRSKTARSN